MQKEFRCITRTVKTPFKLNFAIDFGNEPGAWLVIVIGTSAIGVGYLPKLSYLKTQKKQKPVALTALSAGVQA